jgi:threonine/homoserine/homoserine lactone efflux protein
MALPARATPAWRLIRDGIALNLFNPKLALFFLAFLPQFVPPGPGATPRMVLLVLVFMAMTFAVFVAYGACAASARRYVLQRPAVMRWMRRGFAACFVALGLRLAFSPR